MSERRCLPNCRRAETIEFEHFGIRYLATFGRFDDGTLAELFLSAGRPGCEAETAARDAAILCSLALQHGATLETIRHALTRLPNGDGAGPVGHALDLIEAGPNNE